MVEGFKRIGIEVVETSGEEIPVNEFDFAMFYGLKQMKPRALELFNAQCKPCCVIECGFFKRGCLYNPGYLQMGISQLLWLPAKRMPGDRWEKLNLPIESIDVQDAPILLAGQVPGDAQHNMTSMEMVEWYNWIVSQAHQQGRAVIYRPHPKTRMDEFIWPFKSDPSESLDTALRASGGCITYNSTVGTECIRLGLPVYCSDAANYHNLSSGVDLRYVAPLEIRKEYLYRLAYSQWSYEEIGSGEAQKFWLSQVPEWKKMMQYQARMRKRLKEDARKTA